MVLTGLMYRIFGDWLMYVGVEGSVGKEVRKKEILWGLERGDWG